jgi:threonine/homoserine/homoserine lactone efflux protein
MFGLSTSFLGMIFPSMLNMTSVKISIERGKFNAIKFAMGVSTIVLLQAYGAVFFTKYLNENPDFIITLQKIAVVIFAVLSIYFYRENKKANKNNSQFVQNCKDTFVIGLLLSALNMFAIPFYYGIVKLLLNAGLLKLSQNNIILFVIGTAIGTFILLYLYPNLARFIPVKSKKSSNNLNLVLSILTGVLALITFIKIFEF